MKKKKKTRRKVAKRLSRRARRHAKFVAGKKKTHKKHKKIKKHRQRLTKKKIKRTRKTRKTRKSRKRITRKRASGSFLEQLFESSVKVQIMKFFFRNTDKNFLLKEIAKTIKIALPKVRKQARGLEKIGLIKTRQVSARKQLFSINPNFDFFSELKALILKASPISKEAILKSAKRLGRIKLVLLSGLLAGNESSVIKPYISRADLLIVGSNINQRRLNNFIKHIEAEAGSEINCVIMETEEFKYRYDMYDRFIRDLLNEKNEILVNKLNF